MLLDVTESKRAEENSRRLAAIVESSADAIISKDLNGIIRTWNRGAERLFGYQAEEVIGQPINILMPPDLWNEEPGILERIRRGDRIEQYETVRRRKNGSTIEISLTVSPIRDAQGKVTGASKIARDITQQKQAERDLARVHEEAVAASRAKDDFLAALSHELRTPLNPALLVASEAAEDPQLSAEVRAQFATIRHNVEMEARLIDDLLDITRITHGKLSLNLGVVDAHALLQEALLTVRSELDQKRIALKTNLKAERYRVKGDAVRLQQVFWNVLKNAVKFTAAGGNIAVATSTNAATEALIISITDDGIGMTSPELARIFEAFAQGEHVTERGAHRFGGLGLGLAISRRLVELHAGKICASSPGRDQGSTFTITLPLTAKQPGPARPPAGDTLPPQSCGVAHSGSIRILLVEDHEATRTTLAHLLTRRRYGVKTAATVAEARALAAEEEFHLLISDIGLPDGNGFDLMKELRARQKNLRGIALTGYGMEQDVAYSREAGFGSHLTKPVRIESLESALASVLATCPSAEALA
jgi:PAS domain S-box-containing protein